MPTAQRIGATLAGVLMVIAVAFLAFRAAGVPIGIGAGATPTPTPSTTVTPGASPSDRAPSSEPSVPSEEEALAILAEIEEQVIAIRGLAAADIGPAEIITREELGVELQERFDAEYPQEERDRDNVTLRALGLIEPGQDAADLQLELLGDQVLGFYDDVEKRMVVVSDAGLDIEARITYAHEYTHALQDAAFGLDSLETDAVGEDDRGLARTAMLEGDATVTMLSWMFQHLSQEEILAYLGSAEVPDTSGVPSWMIAQLTFPYAAGQNWVLAQVGGDPLTPDFTAIDAAYDDPPTSTEQIIDIEKWEPREDPDPVSVPDLAGTLGAGWEEAEESPIGQATISIMLEFLGVAPADAQAAADGWGGDRMIVVTGPEEAFAVAWRLAWDTADDAAEFADAYQTVVDGLDFPASVTELPNGEILVVHASSEDVLAETLDAAD